ncbi:cyanamide hydratase [Nocardia brasiliensis]|uniref:HD/PDEase domain-containing protein n=1 Tax=Nocardia brasiliensis (strain ATCC 700358 / HUJEG-1) TaxID=1133849 RepID=K0F4N6_NOCB7|nr:cyanamide hydratase [Nocardia brasiliensis]AFU02501.1 hypothetical protein O3I_022730 [Nocardia brasiliensis ATCC 700358]OCF86465.1 cyanamide hydratase [Nocardia brasiliensis]
MSAIELPDVETVTTRAAREVARQYCSPSLFHHSARAFIWAALLAQAESITVDTELLYVASMFHDIGLADEFDSYAVDFEDAGGHVAAVFAAGAGWSERRRRRLHEIIVRHMWDHVEVDQDPEGHLLARSTGIDISGREADLIPLPVREQVLTLWPRLELADEFTDCFDRQAARKPRSAAAAAMRNGLARKLRANPLQRGTTPA